MRCLIGVVWHNFHATSSVKEKRAHVEVKDNCLWYSQNTNKQKMQKSLYPIFYYIPLYKEETV